MLKGNFLLTIKFRNLFFLLFASCFLCYGWFPILVQGQDYDENSNLELHWLNITDQTRPEEQAATCADGSAAGYYYDGPNTAGNHSFFIWLGDSPLCSGEQCDCVCKGSGVQVISDVCKDVPDGFRIEPGATQAERQRIGRCFLARAVCTSDWYLELAILTPLTIMREEEKGFRDFRRVFVPSCSLDWWLGDGDQAGQDSNGQTSSRFRGSRILDELLEDLMEKYDLHYAPTVVFGGTRGGAIGVLNNLHYLREKIQSHPDANKDQVVLAVVDSAWYPQMEAFEAASEESDDPLNRMRQTLLSHPVDDIYFNRTSDFILQGTVNSDCRQRWEGSNQLYKCLFASEVLKHLQQERIFVIQSRYDVVHMTDYGLISIGSSQEDGEETSTNCFIKEKQEKTKEESNHEGSSKGMATKAEQDASFAAQAIAYVEAYGDIVRYSIEAYASIQGVQDNHYFFVPSCGQHGYIVPTRLHSFFDGKVKTLPWTPYTLKILNSLQM